MAQFVFFRSVNRTDTPAPLPFILISILSDKPPQSHSRSRLYPSTHDTSCRPSPKPQRGSNSTPLSAHPPPTHSTPPHRDTPPSSFCPSPCPGRCWLAGTEACLDRNARGEEGRERRMEGGIREKYAGGGVDGGSFWEKKM